MKILTMTSTVAWLLLVASPIVSAEHTRDTLDVVEENLGARRAVMVDVREVGETNKGYIDGAVLVPLTLLKEGVGDAQFAEVLAQRLPKKSIIYLYCRSGSRCLVAGQILSQLGYETRPLKQGFADLAREGFVTARPKM